MFLFFQAVHLFAVCEWSLLMKMITPHGSELWSTVWALKQMLPKVLWSHRFKPLTLILGLMGGSPTLFTVRHVCLWLMCWRSVCSALSLHNLDYCKTCLYMFVMRLNRSRSQWIYFISENHIKIYARVLVFYLDILPMYRPTHFSGLTAIC